MNQTERPSTASSVSTGAGIAILGAWLAGAAVTITLLLIVFGRATVSSTQIDPVAAAFAFFGIAAPLYAAYKITKVILDKDDD